METSANALGRAGSTPVLDRWALNRATLARQGLLARWAVPVEEAVGRLVGLQAQTPHSWYVGLWSRLEGFRPGQAADLLSERQLVRIALMRSTIHLVTAADCLALRPVVQPVIERGVRGQFGKRLAGLAREEVAAARTLLEERPRTAADLAGLLEEHFPGRDRFALGQAVRAWVPLVQVPPRGLWGRSGPIAHTSAEAWLGRPLDPDPSPETMLLRYLAAFGPASTADAQVWSGLTRLGETLDRLRPRLVTFRDGAGQEMFDLPDGPRPDPETPAPPRFLYDYDNLLLSHADRSRVVGDGAGYARQGFGGDGRQPSTLLLDGVAAATWTIARARGETALTVRPFRPLYSEETAAAAEEGARLLAFAAAEARNHDVRFLPPL